MLKNYKDSIYYILIGLFIILLLVLIFGSHNSFESFVAPYIPSFTGWGPEWPWRWYQWSGWQGGALGWGTRPLSYASFPKIRRGMSYDIRGDPYIQPAMVSPWYNPTVLPIRNRIIL